MYIQALVASGKKDAKSQWWLRNPINKHTATTGVVIFPPVSFSMEGGVVKIFQTNRDFSLRNMSCVKCLLQGVPAISPDQTHTTTNEVVPWLRPAGCTQQSLFFSFSASINSLNHSWTQEEQEEDSDLQTHGDTYVVWGGSLELWTWCKVLFSPPAWSLRQRS